MALVIRPAGPEHLEALWDFLAIAAYEPDAAAARSVPSVAAYLAGWQRPGDFGFVAQRDDEIIGAAWARQFSPDEHKSVRGAEGIPMVSIGVSQGARGHGTGEKLLRALIAESHRRRLKLCLSVRTDNPARRLYERLGFRTVPGSATANRVGGTSIGMLLNVSPSW